MMMNKNSCSVGEAQHHRGNEAKQLELLQVAKSTLLPTTQTVNKNQLKSLSFMSKFSYLTFFFFFLDYRVQTSCAKDHRYGQETIAQSSTTTYEQQSVFFSPI